MLIAAGEWDRILDSSANLVTSASTLKPYYHFSDSLILYFYMFERQPWLKEQFFNLITSVTGLNIREQDQDAICRKLYYRIKTLHISTPDAYYKLLISSTLQSQQEWRELILELTTTESYFFRDKGVFKLLKTVIFPQLIEKAKHRFYQGAESQSKPDIKTQKLPPMSVNYSSNTSLNQQRADFPAKPTLRIWSAGCSTGEEPYSLAICLQELIPDWEQWDLMILGTDINEIALEKARQGVYNSWSFRSVNDNIKQQYFAPQKSNLMIHKSIKKYVHFMYSNLVQDVFPMALNPDLPITIAEMDLIICRNVFVYFEPRFIGLVLQKFWQTLNPGGYLITGHAELHSQDVNLFKAHIFPESVVYQKPENFSVSPPPASSVPLSRDFSDRNHQHYSPQPVYLEEQISKSGISGSKIDTPSLVESKVVHLPTAFHGPETRKMDSESSNSDFSRTVPLTTPNEPKTQLFSEAETLFRQEQYSLAIEKAQQLIQQEPQHFNAYYLLGQIYANLGQYQKASAYCEEALKIDSTSIAVYYLLMEISEEMGDINKAKMLLKRIIYFYPSAVVAYLHLATIYENENDKIRAKKMYQTAFNLMKNLPSNSIPEPHNNLTVAELTGYLNQMLQKYSQA